MQLDGLFYQGDVWLDGDYVGDTEGYCFPHHFEVTHLLQQRDVHVLAVEVTSPRPDNARNKRALVGAFGQGDHCDPGWNPGGIWRPVRLLRTGSVAVRHARLKCVEATEERATLALRLVLDTVTGQPVTLRTRIGGVEHVLERSLAAGENRVEWTVAVPRPDRWWPHSLGPAPLHDLVVDVIAGTPTDQPMVSDTRRWRTGLRSMELRKWHWHVNGERLFVKGANCSPLRQDLANASIHELARDLRAARAAGLDLIRLHTHISRPELYAAADELGILIWQDLPLHRHYARGVRKQAIRQAARSRRSAGASSFYRAVVRAQ